MNILRCNMVWNICSSVPFRSQIVFSRNSSKHKAKRDANDGRKKDRVKTVGKRLKATEGFFEWDYELGGAGKKVKLTYLRLTRR